MGYPLDQLNEEVAFVAYHLHWTQHEVMEMEHLDRRDWVARVSELNRRGNGE